MTDTVLIAGAGPTGLALAVHLALNDIPVHVVDAADGPATTSRALGLQPRGVEVLERLGALGDLLARSRSLLTLDYVEGGRTVLRLRAGQTVLAKPALLVSQAEVEGALRARFAALGGVIHWGTRLVDARTADDRVVARLRSDGGERTVEAGWLVGCDGAHSAVRKTAGIGFPGRQLFERMLMVDVRARWPYDRDGSTTWMDVGHVLSVTSLPDDVWRVFSEAPPDLPEALSEEEVVDRVLGEFSRRSGLAADTVSEVRWATEFRVHRRLAETYRRGRVLLAGDAAHIQSPSGGQGQNTGLGDAENLGWKLVLVSAGRADQRLLDTYEAERRPLAAKVLAATSTAVDVMLPDTRWKRVVRDRLVVPALRLGFVQRRLWLAASQLGIDYRGGPLAPGTPWWTTGPRPGDRVPDVACRRYDGVEVTLHAATAGSWVVLARDPAAHAAAAAVHLGQVTALTPVRPTRREVFLIRPDGHLAWRGRAAPEKLSAWLTQVLWPERSAVAVPATPATTTRSWTRRSTSSSNAAPRARASRPSPGARESRN
ncbi:FAD-dependent monooxygenase [Umezawaea sp. NPDC059074]|uniref:FAD-dependent monooxygenase n=1 Tax=Umezawaea sp. NPDC059074 TaxID=3346716 RepID=UPI0036C48749